MQRTPSNPNGHLFYIGPFVKMMAFLSPRLAEREISHFYASASAWDENYFELVAYFPASGCSVGHRLVIEERLGKTFATEMANDLNWLFGLTPPIG